MTTSLAWMSFQEKKTFKMMILAEIFFFFPSTNRKRHASDKPLGGRFLAQFFRKYDFLYRAHLNVNLTQLYLTNFSFDFPKTQILATSGDHEPQRIVHEEDHR